MYWFWYGFVATQLKYNLHL